MSRAGVAHLGCRYFSEARAGEVVLNVADGSKCDRGGLVLPS